MKIFEVKVYVVNTSGGDGSVYNRFFKTEEEAEKRAQQEEESGYECFTEQPSCETLLFGFNENGELEFLGEK